MLKAIRRSLPIILLGVLLSSGCVATIQAPQSLDANLQREVLAFEAKVMDSYNQGDAVRAAGLYAKDAYVVGQEPTPTRGRDRIATNISRFMRDPNFALSYVNEIVGVSASGDLAYTRGKLKVTVTDRKTNSAQAFTGSYILVMRREATSGWQVVEDISYP
jgi:ketosteroid isomerase-like protein